MVIQKKGVGHELESTIARIIVTIKITIWMQMLQTILVVKLPLKLYKN